MYILKLYIIYRSGRFVIGREGDHQQAAPVPQTALCAGQQQPLPRAPGPGLPGDLRPRGRQQQPGQQQHL